MREGAGSGLPPFSQQESSMIPMIAEQYQRYEGRWYHAGDEMEVATETDANDMVALNLARRVKKPTIERREMEPGDVRSNEDKDRTVDVVKPTTPAKKKDTKYAHREMRSRQ